MFSVIFFPRRAASREMKMTRKRTRAEETGSTGTRCVLASTWSVFKEGRTGAAVAAHQSSGTCPHTCTLTTVMEGPPATVFLLAWVSTTPPWPSPWLRPPHKSQRKKTRKRKKMRKGKQCREMEQAWDHLTTLPPKMDTSTSPPSPGWGRRKRWTMEVGRWWRGKEVLPVPSFSRWWTPSKGRRIAQQLGRNTATGMTRTWNFTWIILTARSMRIQLLLLWHRECHRSGYHGAERAKREQEEEKGGLEREAVGVEEEAVAVGQRGRCALRPSRNAPYAPRSFKEQASYPATSERTQERNPMNAPSAKCALPGKPN